MKILLISMRSIHAIRWIQNLDKTEHELYWFDILDRGKLDTIDSVQQFIGWKTRKFPKIKGEYFLFKNFPKFYLKIQPFLEVTAGEIIEQIIREINPDIVHSFEMQSCSYPILKTMNKFPEIKWLYSCWGNDLYYYQNFPDHKRKIKNTLKRVNYLHTDCLRDYQIAKELGFKGKHTGVIPGGTGYNLERLQEYKLPFEQRKIILVKGYQHLFGRGLNVIKALQKMKRHLFEYEVIIFGAHPVIEKYIEENDLNYKIYGRHDLKHLELMKLMGKALLYIGNNISDGMANTLLEAMVMGAFPIQSNPGNVSAEIIEHGSNGFLIEDPENINHIAQLIIQAIQNKEMLNIAGNINSKIAIERLDYSINQQKVIDLYLGIENSIKCE